MQSRCAWAGQEGMLRQSNMFIIMTRWWRVTSTYCKTVASKPSFMVAEFALLHRLITGLWLGGKLGSDSHEPDCDGISITVILGIFGSSKLTEPHVSPTVPSWHPD